MAKAKSKRESKTGKGKKINKKTVAAAVVGLGLLAAGGAYLASSRGAKARRQISAWAKAAKKDLEKQIRKAGALNRAAFESAAGEVVKKYKQLKKLDAKQAGALLADLSAQWEKIRKSAVSKKAGRKI